MNATRGLFYVDASLQGLYVCVYMGDCGYSVGGL